MAAVMPDAADEVIDRLALDLRAHALGEVQFLEARGIPRKLARSLAVQAMKRAVIKIEGEGQ